MKQFLNELSTEVLNGLLGDYKLSFYITYFLFVIIGIIISLWLGSLKRDKLSVATPEKFNFRFLIQDNLLRVLGSISLIFLIIRLGVEINWVPEYYTAAFMGLSFDTVIAKAEKLQDLAREKLK